MFVNLLGQIYTIERHIVTIYSRQDNIFCLTSTCYMNRYQFRVKDVRGRWKQPIRS